MSDINDIKEQLESAQSHLESASWDANQAVDNARDAERNADQALSIVTSAIEAIDDIVGYSKYDVDQAMRHLNFVHKLYSMYLNRLDNIIDGNNEYDEKMKFVNLIALLETVVTSENGVLSFDNNYNLESYYDNDSGFSYKVVKKKEINHA